MQTALPIRFSTDPKRIFFTLLKVVLVLVGILVASFLILMIIQGREHKGFLYLIFIVVSVLIVFRSYFKTIDVRPKLKQEAEPELYGNLESMAAMIWRASKGYDYSKGKLEDTLSSLRGKPYSLQGKGDQYIKTLKEILEEG